LAPWGWGTQQPIRVFCRCKLLKQSPDGATGLYTPSCSPFLSASLYVIVKEALIEIGCVVTLLVVGGWSLVVTRVHCSGQTVHPRAAYSYYGTLIGNPTPGIQWYNFRPPGVTLNRGMGFLSNYFDLLFPDRHSTRVLAVTSSPTGLFYVIESRTLANF